MNRSLLPCLLSLMGLFTACNTDPKASSRRYVGNGNKYFDRAKYKQASIMYRHALQKDPRNGEAWYRLGLVNINDGNLGEARRDFQRSSELDTTPSAMQLEALAKLGDIDFTAFAARPEVPEFWKELHEISDKLLRKNPNSYDGLRLSGYYWITQIRQKDSKENQGQDPAKNAIAKFRAADAAKPGQPEVVTMLVQMLFVDNQPAEAEKLGRDLIEKNKNYDKMYDIMYARYLRDNRPQEAEQLLKKKIAYNPQRGDVLTQLAFFYYLTQRKSDMAATLSELTADRRKYPNGRLLAGDFYYTIRDYNNAVQQYQEGEKENSKDRFTYQKKLVEALTMSGKRAEAAKVVAVLLKEHPNDPEAVAIHASVLLQGGDAKQADAIIAELQPLLAKTPASQQEHLAILHFNLARAYALKGDPASLDQARLHFQGTLAIKSNYVPAKLALAQLELNRGDNSSAIQHATEVLALDRNNLTARLVRAVGLMNTKDYDQSRQELDSLEKEYPRSNDVRFQLARLNFTQRRFKEAEAAFEQLVKSNDPRGLNGILDCKIAQGQLDDAIRLVQAELVKDPESFGYRLALGSLDFNAHRYQDAVREFQTLIDKNAKSPQLEGVYLRMGEAKRGTGDINGAIASFNKARELSPKDPMPLLQVALLLETSGRLDEARKTYEDVLKMQPDNAVALNNIAYAKADEGVDLDTALTFAERARTKKPDDPDVLDTVSLIFLKKNLTDDSLRLSRELVSRVPTRATYRLHFAMALYQKGDKAEAKRELQNAMRYNPSGPEQQRIRELMAKL